MKKTIIVGALAVLAALVLEHLLIIPRVQAQEMSAGSDGFVLYAGVRRDTEKNESFIFHNPKTGEIWVYEDDKVKEHYRVTKVGENLQKLGK